MNELELVTKEIANGYILNAESITLYNVKNFCSISIDENKSIRFPAIIDDSKQTIVLMLQCKKFS